MKPSQTGTANIGRSHRAVDLRAVFFVFLFFGLATIGLSDDRTILHPGFNLFSPQQDIELGQKASAQVPRQFPLLNDKRVDNYLQQLGLRLAAHAPGYKYPYQYRCINSEVINAFALPGGFIYINRGVIENADNEAQLAAVMAHETSHVALRHGTNQATKAYAAQAGLGIVGALVGGNAAASIMTQLLGGAGLPLVFLKMSRTDESQADILGTQILHDAGYDPQAMADFFSKLEKKNESQPVEFFSDHPSPEHRVERVDQEIDRLNGAPPNAKTDSPEFEAIKRYVKSLPAPPKTPNPQASGAASGPPAPPSKQYSSFSNSEVALSYPDNWNATQSQNGGGVALVPNGGAIQNGQGSAALAYGVIISVFAPANVSAGAPSLSQATDQLVTNLQQSNPKMNVTRKAESTKLSGQPALSMYLENDSPVGGREADWLITTLRPDGLFYIICVAPQKDYSAYSSAFRSVVHSVRFPN